MPAGAPCMAYLARMPRSAAQLSSRSMVSGSQVPACHISSWLPALDGTKLQPLSQPHSSGIVLGVWIGLYWFNTRRLFEPTRKIPPTEFEAQYRWFSVNAMYVGLEH